MKENLLISACLSGVSCRYDGSGKLLAEIEELKKRYHLIPVCPEIIGGLPTPRIPSECISERVVTREGADVTANFLRGAAETLKLAQLFDCRYALLKERSPSCGHGSIYDGSFSGSLVPGNGITARLLMQNGILVFGESQLENLL